MQDSGGRIEWKMRERVGLRGKYDKVIFVDLFPPSLERSGGLPHMFIVLVFLLKARDLWEAQCERVRGVLENASQGGAGAGVISRSGAR